MFLSIFSLIILLFYVVLIVIYTIGWLRIPLFEATKNVETSFTISIVVACKDEEDNLPNLLQCIKNQSYNDFELILVDDNSHDNTWEIMQMWKSEFKDITVIKSNGNSKKVALSNGIEIAKGELILTTDADCIPELSWVETIVKFQTIHNCSLLICPVKISHNNSIFQELQSLEFASLIASSGGAAGIKSPIMCNGANLAFTKKAWIKSKEHLKFNEPSGDDVFLMFSIKKRGEKIRFLKSKSAIVATHAQPTLQQFIHQRKRWTSKSPSYTDFHIIITALIVFMVNSMILLNLVLGFINHWNLMICAIMVVAKFLIDFLFLSKVKNFFGLKNLLLTSFILTLLYPFYTIGIALSTFIKKPTSWK